MSIFSSTVRPEFPLSCLVSTPSTQLRLTLRVMSLPTAPLVYAGSLASRTLPLIHILIPLTGVSSSFAYGLHIQGCSFHLPPMWTGHRASPSISPDSGNSPFYPRCRAGGPEEKECGSQTDSNKQLSADTHIHSPCAGPWKRGENGKHISPSVSGWHPKIQQSQAWGSLQCHLLIQPGGISQTSTYSVPAAVPGTGESALSDN